MSIFKLLFRYIYILSVTLKPYLIINKIIFIFLFRKNYKILNLRNRKAFQNLPNKVLKKPLNKDLMNLWWTRRGLNPQPYGCEQAPETFFEYFRRFLAVSVWPKAVCGMFCGQKRSQPLPTGTGSVFHASNCLHCTSVDRIKQVISVLSTVQKLRDCKQKEAFCSKRLRNLKRMFMRILHLL